MKIKFLLITIVSLLIAGCGSGGGGGGSLSSLFGSGNAGGSVSNIVSNPGGGGILLARTPEPSTLALLGIGLVGLVATIIRKKHR